MTETKPLDCRRCKAFCCKMAGYVEVSNGDIRRLAKHFHLKPKAFEAKYLVRVTRAGKKRIKEADATCQFLGPNHSCTVYAARPKNCREYICWDQDDTTVYDFASLAQLPANAMRKREAEAEAEAK